MADGMLSTEIQITLHHKIQTKTLHEGTTELNISHTTSIISPVLTNKSIGLVKRSFFPPSEVFVSNTYKITVPHLIQRPPPPPPHSNILIYLFSTTFRNMSIRNTKMFTANKPVLGFIQTNAGFSFHFFLVLMYKKKKIYFLKKPYNVILCGSLGME